MLILLLCGCVLAHEMGHGLAAHWFGLPVRRITLLPTGGIIQLEAAPSNPGQEMWIALAGPLVNLLLSILAAAFLLFLPVRSVSVAQSFDFLTPRSDLWTILLLWIGSNVSLFALNIIPMFPMDGGRIARSGLAMWIGYLSATNIIASLSNWISLGLIGIGLIGWIPLQYPPNLFIAWMGLAIYMGSRQETIDTRRQWALARIEAHQVANANADILNPWDELTPSIARHLFRYEHFIPVVVGQKLVGLVSYRDVHQFLKTQERVTIAHVMKLQSPMVDSHATLWVVLREMNTSNLPALPVIDKGQFTGMITLQDIENSWRLVKL
jgi:Zn-dependent protease